jgi:hypothetical protein
MGVDLCQYGNHKINFTGRNLAEIAEEIKEKLNSIKLVNIDYLKVLMNLWDNAKFEAPEIQIKNEKTGIYKEIVEEEWNWEYEIIDGYEDDEDEDENDDYVHYQYIKFTGFRNFELEFTKDKIFFWDPPYRYADWFHMGKIIRDQWRIYMLQIISSFGGNRAIYLPDNMLDAEVYLDEHDGIDSPFEEIEQGLINQFGKYNIKIDEAKENDGFEYFIDDFSDLELNNKMTVKEFQDYLWKGCIESFKIRLGINESELDYYFREIFINNNAEKLIEDRVRKWHIEHGNE